MKPVVIENLTTHWPALEKWDLFYLWSKMKGRTVPVEEGEKYTDEDWGQKLISFDDFISSFEKPEIIQYLAQHPLLEQVPDLEDDIIIPGNLRFRLIGNFDEIFLFV